MVDEARLHQSESGLEPASGGWSLLNARDAVWMTNEALGACGLFESDAAPFRDLGYTLSVLWPGQRTLYHREANQEDFLVLSGECLVVVEEEERRLKAWDLVHCPANTEHAFVGTGDGPCVIFMTGARATWPEKGIVYPRSEVALRHSAGVESETSSPAEAYAPLPKWQLGRPDDWDALPWA